MPLTHTTRDVASLENNVAGIEKASKAYIADKQHYSAIARQTIKEERTRLTAGKGPQQKKEENKKKSLNAQGEENKAAKTFRRERVRRELVGPSHR